MPHYEQQPTERGDWRQRAKNVYVDMHVQHHINQHQLCFASAQPEFQAYGASTQTLCRQVTHVPHECVVGYAELVTFGDVSDPSLQRNLVKCACAGTD